MTLWEIRQRLESIITLKQYLIACGVSIVAALFFHAYEIYEMKRGKK